MLDCKLLYDQVFSSHDTDDKIVRYQGDADGDVDYHGSSEDDDSDDDDGWITPGNIHEIKADYGISETQSRPYKYRCWLPHHGFCNVGNAILANKAR